VLSGYEKVKDFLEDAWTNGKLIAGGHALEREGYFIAPTIVRDIGDDACLVREEQFGPILPVLSFENVEDAIARTNDTDYGFGESVWTGDVERGVAVASKVQSGAVLVNKSLDMPFESGARQTAGRLLPAPTPSRTAFQGAVDVLVAERRCDGLALARM
jgi:acyl-CoA reductase-like NAD-dependent aldehyde dehydrogenase